MSSGPPGPNAADRPPLPEGGRVLQFPDRPAGPQRVQLSRAAGWRMPPNTVKVDRSTRWGNPFVVGYDGTAQHCVAWFKSMLAGNLPQGLSPSIAQVRAYRAFAASDLETLRGKNLACWCAPGSPCHADVLLKLANR